jgi:hypothetical protein
MLIITAHPDRLCEPGFTDFTLYDDGTEELITVDAEHVYRYALHVINGKCPEGEEAIAQDPYWAYKYARDVLCRL